MEALQAALKNKQGREIAIFPKFNSFCSADGSKGTNLVPAT